MISSGGKFQRLLFVLLIPLLSIGVILAYIWGGIQGSTAFFNKVESWIK